MNLILFETVFQQVRLVAEDPRTKHIRSVLGIKKGGVLFVGFINGERAVAELRQLNTDGSIELAVVETEEAPLLLPIDLVIGMPRPHSARRILLRRFVSEYALCISFNLNGVSPPTLRVVCGKKGTTENAYVSPPSNLSLHIYQKFIWGGRLKQSFRNFPNARVTLVSFWITMLPKCHWVALIESQTESGLKNSLSAEGVVLVLGSERGWTQGERAAFAGADWQFALLGSRVLRTETAVVSAVSILVDRLNLGSQRTQSRLLHLYN